MSIEVADLIGKLGAAAPAEATLHRCRRSPMRFLVHDPVIATNLRGGVAAARGAAHANTVVAQKNSEPYAHVVHITGFTSPGADQKSLKRQKVEESAWFLS